MGTTGSSTTTLAVAGAPLRIGMVAPLGRGGRGGMDRLADIVIAELEGPARGQGIEVVRLTTRGPRGLPYSAWYFVVALAKLALLLIGRRLDVLHIHLAAGGSTSRKSLLAGMARLAGVPVIVHVHSGRFPEYWREASPAAAQRIARLLDGSAMIIVLCRAHGDAIAELLPSIRDRITVLANATPSRPRARIPQPGAPVTLTFLGILMQQKGVGDLLSALAKLDTETPWHATVAGYGYLDEFLRQRADLDLTGKVSFPGWLDEAGVDDLLSRTDVYVLPSYSEGLPMSILEAFAAGVPVVATPLPAIVEVVEDGRTGCLVPVGDVDALAAALARLIDDAPLRRRMGDAGRVDHAARFAIEPYVEKLADLWRAVRREAKAPAAMPNAAEPQQ